MVKSRIIETYEGIQDETVVKDYNLFLRNMRDKGWMKTEGIITAGIKSGHVLEVGPGPGYLGLEWLSRTENTFLTGIEISQNMINLATENARDYQLLERVCYQLGNADQMPFPDECFDGVFSNGSLHEWDEPERIFSEIHRVLKSGGQIYISDLKRDLSLPVKCLFYSGTKPKSMRQGLSSSIRAAYTKDELEEMLKESALRYTQVKSDPFGLTIFGVKP